MKRTCLFGHKNSLRILSEKLEMFSFGRKELNFSICKDCGFIFQSKTVEPSEMKNYYDQHNLDPYLYDSETGDPSYTYYGLLDYSLRLQDNKR